MPQSINVGLCAVIHLSPKSDNGVRAVGRFVNHECGRRARLSAKGDEQKARLTSSGAYLKSAAGRVLPPGHLHYEEVCYDQYRGTSAASAAA